MAPNAERRCEAKVASLPRPLTHQPVEARRDAPLAAEEQLERRRRGEAAVEGVAHLADTRCEGGMRKSEQRKI